MKHWRNCHEDDLCRNSADQARRRAASAGAARRNADDACATRWATPGSAGSLETYRGHEYKTNLLRKIALEIAVNDDFVERTVECLEEVARTSAEGHIGDGKIFVVPMEQAIQISDGYSGKGAI